MDLPNKLPFVYFLRFALSTIEGSKKYSKMYKKVQKNYKKQNKILLLLLLITLVLK